MSTRALQSNQIKIEVPQIDPIFTLDCLKLNEMKNLFKLIFDYLNQFSVRLCQFPDVRDIMQRLAAVEKSQIQLKSDTEQDIEDLKKIIQNLDIYTKDRFQQMDVRVTKLEQKEFKIDYNLIFQRDEFKQIKKNIDILQDYRDDHEKRIQVIESQINNQIIPQLNENFGPRILKLEHIFESMSIALNEKVNLSEMKAELEKKAEISVIDYLKENIFKLKEQIIEFENLFANKAQNDKEHKLLQKQLKALYELIMSKQTDEDDPMFTVKGLRCAACAKGVQNLEKFKASYIPWAAFPNNNKQASTIGGRYNTSNDQFSQIFTSPQPGDMHYTQSMNNPISLVQTVNHQQSNPNFEHYNSPARNEDDIFLSKGRKIVSQKQNGRPQSAVPKSFNKLQQQRQQSVSNYKAINF